MLIETIQQASNQPTNTEGAAPSGLRAMVAGAACLEFRNAGRFSRYRSNLTVLCEGPGQFGPKTAHQDDTYLGWDECIAQTLSRLDPR
jgi:hypothetical protein